MNQKHPSTLPVSDRWSFLWLGIAALLLVFTYGMYRNLLGGMLAYVFLLRFMRSKKVTTGFLFALLALGVSNTIAWWYTVNELPAIARVIMGVIVGLLYSIPPLLDRVLVGRFRGFAATLVFPLTNAAFEFLTIWPNPMTTFGSIAYSQSGSSYLNQLVSVTGLWGVTFLVSWFASTLNWIWEEGAAWYHIRRGVTIYAGVMLVVLLYGVVRLTYFFPQSGTVRIHGIVETDYTVDEWGTRILPLSTSDPEAFRAVTRPIFARYLQSTIREARAGAQIVVWPELAAEGYKEDVAALLEQARDIARQESIYLVVGVGIVPPSDPAKPYLDNNRLIIIDQGGNIVVDQFKYGCSSTLLYGFEIQTVETPYGRLAGVICCDLDYPYVVRQMSQKGVDILIVPAFEPTPEEMIPHSQMASYRAVENGVSIYRATTQGLSLAIDPYGRLLGSMNHTTTSEPVFVAQLPNRHIFTVYSAVGDLFGWLSVAGFVVMAGWAILRGRKTRVESVH